MIELSESTPLGDQEDDEKPESRAFLGEQSTRLVLTAGVAGTLQRPLQEMRVEGEDGEVQDRKVRYFMLCDSQSFLLSTRSPFG